MPTKSIAQTQPSVTAGNFSAIAKTALEHAIKTDSNGLNIDAEKVGTFAGSPAYVVNASSRSGYRGSLRLPRCILLRTATICL